MSLGKFQLPRKKKNPWAPENRSMQVLEQVLVVEGPPPVKFKEETLNPTYNAQYPSTYRIGNQDYDMTEVHMSYRGTDKVKFVHPEDGSTGKLFSDNRCPAMIGLENPFRDNEYEHYGYPARYAVPGTTKPKAFLSSTFSMESQCFSLKVRINLRKPQPGDEKMRPETIQRNVEEHSLTWQVFANHLVKTENGVAMEILPPWEDAKLKEHLDALPILQNLHDQQQLCRIDLKLDQSGIFYGPAVGRVVELGDRYRKDQSMSEAEAAVGALFHAKQVSISYGDFKPNNNRGRRLFEDFANYAMTCMALSAHLGNYYYSQLQFPEIPIEDVNLPFHECQPPRWLAKTWKAWKRCNDVARLEMLSWESFAATNFNPGSSALSLLYRLGESCEWNDARRRIRIKSEVVSAANNVLQPVRGNDETQVGPSGLGQEMSDAQAVACHGEFYPNRNQNGQYIIKLSVDDIEAPGLVGFKRPEPKQRCTVVAKVGGKDVFYRGFTIEGVNDQVDRIIAVTSGSYEPLLHTGFHNVQFFSRAEDEPVNGRMIAISTLSQGQDRREGVYLPDITLMMERPTGQKVNWLAREMEAHSNKWSKYMAEIGRQKLNEVQIAVSKSPLASESSVTLVNGPSGTSKTKIGMAMAVTFEKAGFKVLVTASLDTAVKAALSQFHKLLDLFLDEEFVHFRTA